MIILLLIVTVLFWAIDFRYKRRWLYESALKVPEFSGGKPLLGFIPDFMGNSIRIMSLLKKLSDKCVQMGGIGKLWLNHMLIFMISDPADLEKVLKNCYEKDDSHRFFRKLIGNGILFAPASIWKIRRKHMLPALSNKFFDNSMNILVKESNKLVEKLDPLCGTGQFSLKDFIERFAFTSITETAFGVDLNAQADPNVPFLTAFERGSILAIERYFRLWFQPDCIYKLFRNKYLQYIKTGEDLQGFVNKIVLAKMKEIKEKDRSNVNGVVNSTYQSQVTILDLLIKLSGADNGYNDIELTEELLSIILAATDTSAVAICNTLVLLKLYPKIQEEVHRELADIFGDSDRPFTKSDLTKLVYLERVIKESMRVCPPVPVIGRKVLTDITLPSGYVLPANSTLWLSIYGVHRDPKYWGPDAECFNPDRFLPERLNLPSPYCFIPFSNGPRNCVGIYYAMISIKAALATILRRYKVVGTPAESPVPDIKMDFQITMKAVDGWRVGLERK